MSDEFKVQWSVSLPPAAQYAKGDMLNIRGESVEEVEALFDEALSGEFIDKATQVGALLRAAATVQDGLSQPSGGASDAPAESSGTGDVVRVCTHGKRVFKEGKSKAGKPWSGWFCPEKNRSSQCEVQWAD